MSPASARRLQQEQMQQATIKRRLAQWRLKNRPATTPFAEMRNFVRDLMEQGRALEMQDEQQPEGPRH